MVEDFAFPEIVFVDGTYQLFTRNFTLMLMIVEDHDAHSRIVGLGILANEKRDTLYEFFKCFNDENSSSVNNIMCFMTDKDLTEKSVISDLIPGKHMYLCQFHVLRALSREVSSKRMEISSVEKLISLQYLDRLVKAETET